MLGSRRLAIFDDLQNSDAADKVRAMLASTDGQPPSNLPQPASPTQRFPPRPNSGLSASVTAGEPTPVPLRSASACHGLARLRRTNLPS